MISEDFNLGEYVISARDSLSAETRKGFFVDQRIANLI